MNQDAVARSAHQGRLADPQIHKLSQIKLPTNSADTRGRGYNRRARHLESAKAMDHKGQAVCDLKFRIG